MEVLRFNRKYFKILGLLWSAKNDGTIYRILKICVHAVYIFTYVTGPMSNVLYIYHHPNLLNAVSAFFLTGATCSGFGSYLGFILNEQNIKKLVRDLQDLVDNGKCHSLYGLDFPFDQDFTFRNTRSGRDVQQRGTEMCSDFKADGQCVYKTLYSVHHMPAYAASHLVHVLRKLRHFYMVFPFVNRYSNRCFHAPRMVFACIFSFIIGIYLHFYAHFGCTVFCVQLYLYSNILPTHEINI